MSLTLTPPAITLTAPAVVDVTTVPYAPNAYCTVEDMALRFREQELIELTDRAGCATLARVDAIIIMAINDAAADMDAVLGQRYALPIVGCLIAGTGTDPVTNPALYAPPALLVRINAVIARWFLYQRSKPGYGEHAAGESVRVEYDWAQGELKKLSVGEMPLVCPLGEAAAQRRGGQVLSCFPDAQFNARVLDHYAQRRQGLPC